MANSKYLDGGGLQRAWDRIKSWVNTQLAGKANASHTHTYSQITDLSTWKTTNFGSGTYSNNGSINITNADVKFTGYGSNKMLVDLSHHDIRFADEVDATDGYCFGIRLFWSTTANPKSQTFVNDYKSRGYFMIISNNSVQSYKVDANAKFEATISYGMIIVCFIH